MRPVLWRAGGDQIAHAHERRGQRTLCGIRVVDERLAWPPVVRCPDCATLAAKAA